MTLDGLLAFTGLAIAIIAIASAVQRHSILLFVPWKLLAAALICASTAVLYQQTMSAFHVELPPLSNALIRVASFAAPTLALLACWQAWHQASLRDSTSPRVREVLRSAMRDGVYDEVERILRKNTHRIGRLPADVLHLVFDRKVVRAVLDAHSHLHLDLLRLGDKSLLSRADRSSLLFVDNVVRECVLVPTSPWRSAVLSKFGGHDVSTYLEEEETIVSATLENPEWYVKAAAHAPLSSVAIEAIQSGRLDVDYNQASRRYESLSGLSSRADCPVFLAAKMQELAIKSAVAARSDEDLYVTNLWELFRAILDHSRADPAIWNSPLGNAEHPTPYAYLLDGITQGLLERLWEGLSASTQADSGSTQLAPPVDIDRQVAMTWSFCVWRIAGDTGGVSRDFRLRQIQTYLDTILQLHAGGNGIPTLPANVSDCQAWRDMLFAELQQRFRGASALDRTAINDAIGNLDRGKDYVSNGHDWLIEELK